MPLSTSAWKRLRDDSGAVTTDWVILTAALVALALPVIVMVRNGAEATGSQVSDSLETATLDPIGALVPGSD